jgi:GDP-L-fucose synthase
MNLQDKRILITGSNGFLGQHVCQTLINRGCLDLGTADPRETNLEAKGFYRVRSTDFDLTREDRVKALYNCVKPDIVIHLAAVVGGIGINRKKPGTFYYKNLMMGALLMEHARQNRVEKFVAVGTICAYPKFCPVPFREEDLWDGYPEETNAPYGIAKKAMLVQAQAYRQEFGFNAIYLLPVNLYGPGDNFDPETSHVIPALIKKMSDARKQELKYVECWGSGTVTREFLYVTDAAEAIVLATESYNKPDPINLGSSHEIAIRHIAEIIQKLIGFKGDLRWNHSYPNGQPRRSLDVSRATRELGFTAKMSLQEGLKKTVCWYKIYKETLGEGAQ